MHTTVYDLFMKEAMKTPRVPNASRRASAVLRNSVHRKKLLAAGAQLFISRGIASVSVEEIIEAAKLSRATFYGSFANKNELAAAILLPVFDSGVAALDELVELPPRKAADGLVDVYLYLWKEHKNALLLTSGIDGAVFPYIASRHQAFNSALLKILQAIESAGLLRNDSAALTIEVLAKTGIPLLRIYKSQDDLERLYRESMRALIFKA